MASVESALLSVQQQQEEQLQQLQQQQPAVALAQVQAQLRALSGLQAELDQQGAQLAALRYRYEERLAGAAAGLSEAAGEAAGITQQLMALRALLEERAAALASLKLAAEATLLRAGELMAAAQQRLDAEQAAAAAAAAGSSSSSSSSSTLRPPGGSSGEAAVLFVGQAPSDQQQQSKQAAQPSSSSSSSSSDAADDVLLLAQRLLDEGMGALLGSSSSSSKDSSQENGSSSSRSGSSRSSTPSGSAVSAPNTALPAVVAGAAAVATQPRAAPAAVKPSRRRQQQQHLRLRAAGVSLPHPAKAKTGGEDAFFISRAGCGGFGVADGVGSWAADGVDAAAYAGGLMAAAADAVERSGGGEGPREVLAYAQKHTAVPGSCTALAAQKHTAVPGSCTALVAQLRPSSLLEVCLVGDVGLRLIRGGRVTAATEVQEHSFNTPYQLGHLGLLPGSDTAGMGLGYSLALAAGDVIIAGSDGLWDNVWDDQLEALVQQGLRHLPPSAAAWDAAAAARLARSVAEVAAGQAADSNFRSPWAVELAERMPQVNFGGGGADLEGVCAVQPIMQSISEVAAGQAGDSNCRSPWAVELAGRMPQAVDSNIKSPWVVELAERVPQAQGLMSRLFGPRGGKPDDITVVVALVA
ncbi:hypothetical protein OEZ85_002385 [Tetradesmus obliquus]|uniref:Protein phosphatase n=1 Tax=Tetradesmus obliquus TaxID=3088 RepID=A0ABY8U3H1_TETOB|nr:hypothetical protein OEZ85_002385 [Tetradesmus obliquus]